jgi:hypothetical protein
VRITSEEVLEIVNSTDVDEIRRIFIEAKVDHAMRRITLRQLCDVAELVAGRLYELAKVNDV